MNTDDNRILSVLSVANKPFHRIYELSDEDLIWLNQQHALAAAEHPGDAAGHECG